MKILSKLSGESAEGTVPAIGTMVAMADEAVVNGQRTGFFRQVELSPIGLAVHHNGTVGVVIPLADILQLAEAHEPALKGPTAADMAQTAARLKAIRG